MQIIQTLIAQFQAFKQKLTAAIANPEIDRHSWEQFSGFIDLGFFLLAFGALGRSFFEADLGIIAIVIATHAMLKALSNILIDQVITAAIGKCDGQELNQVCNNAYRLNWLVALGLFVLQVALAFPLAQLYNNSDLAWPIATLALTFAIYPQGTICLALRQRHNQAQKQAQNQNLSTAAVQHQSQTQANQIKLAERSLNYGAIALFIWADLGIWSIVAAAFTSSLIAQWFRRKSYFWRPNPKLKLKQWRSLFSYVEHPSDLALALIAGLELNLAYLIIGWAIDLNTLGQFFMIVNAGFMITLKIIQLATTANLEALGQLSPSFRGLRQRYREHYQRIALITIPLVIMQSTLVPFYVPLLFSDTWNPTIIMVIILLCAALPYPFAAVGTQLLNATNRSQFNLYGQLSFAVILIGTIFFSLRWQLWGVCIGMAIAYVLLQGAFAIVTSRICLPRLA
jgi:teichuronic acid exporter